MTRRLALTAALALGGVTVAADLAAQGGVPVPAQEWEVPWGAEGRPRDPYVAPDGSVFFAGQAGNYIARLDPKTGTFTRFEIDEGTYPHNLIVDARGQVWYAGNQNGMIGRLDPATRTITRYPMPDPSVRDPHTLIFDAQGNIWFTAQQSNAVGHLDTKTGAIRLVRTGDQDPAVWDQARFEGAAVVRPLRHQPDRHHRPRNDGTEGLHSPERTGPAASHGADQR